MTTNTTLLPWLLITGSRDWPDVDAIRAALLAHGPGVVVHGGCRGADLQAAAVACVLGWPVEAHPADWRRLGLAAGPLRNREMVQRGAAVCLAFPVLGSTGTLDCMRRAIAAGIRTINYGAAVPLDGVEPAPPRR